LVTQIPTSRNYRNRLPEDPDYNGLDAIKRYEGPPQWAARRAALTQHRQDLIPPGQCPCQLAEMLIDSLLDCRIDAHIGG
jgi:hypothetical protein